MIMRPLTTTIAAALLLSACATTPQSPTVQVLSAPHKNFEAFNLDYQTCKQFAGYEVEHAAGHANTMQAVTAVGGTLLGAAAGAAFGGGQGAAIGAGAGLLGGTAVGGLSAAGASGGIQQRYDLAYVQCMATKGYRVPVMQAVR